jgi:hypothetical protein
MKVGLGAMLLAEQHIPLMSRRVMIHEPVTSPHFQMWNSMSYRLVISDGHGTRRDEIWLFIRPARLAKGFISWSQAFGTRPAGVPGHLVHVRLVVVDGMVSSDLVNQPHMVRRNIASIYRIIFNTGRSG